MKNKGKRFKSDKKNTFSLTKLIIFIVLLVIIFIVYFSIIQRATSKDIFIRKPRTTADTVVIEEEIKPKKYKNMEVKDIQLLRDEKGYSHLNCVIKNTQNKVFKGEDVYFIFIGRDNIELAKYRYNLKEIKPGKSIKVNLITSTDITNSEDFYIKGTK